MRDRLETERMVLRRFTEDDVEHLFVLHNDPEVMRFLNGGKPATREEIAREYREHFAGPGYWAAVEKGSGEFLGWFAFHPTADREPDEVELGYRLRRAAWGKGYATEGSRALVRQGFAEPGVRQVWAQTMAVNPGSRRVMEKAGLSLARVFYPEWEEPLPGAEQGEVEYALSRADWERREAAGQPERPGNEGANAAAADAPRETA
jgi:RimJ/RimL family protein N-acetyltransferase